MATCGASISNDQLIVKTFPDFPLWIVGGVCRGILTSRWALLRIEWEVIKTRREEGHNQIISLQQQNTDAKTSDVETIILEEDKDIKPVSIHSSVTSLGMRNSPLKSFQVSDMSELNDTQILT
jgi:hypothetical protein